jgi:hypothetical protein
VQDSIFSRAVVRAQTWSKVSLRVSAAPVKAQKEGPNDRGLQVAGPQLRTAQEHAEGQKYPALKMAMWADLVDSRPGREQRWEDQNI